MDLDAKDDEDETPLTKAAKGNHEEVIRLLVEEGVPRYLGYDGHRYPGAWLTCTGQLETGGLLAAVMLSGALYVLSGFFRSAMPASISFCFSIARARSATDPSPPFGYVDMLNFRITQTEDDFRREEKRDLLYRAVFDSRSAPTKAHLAEVVLTSPHPYSG